MSSQRLVGPVIDPCQKAIGRLGLDRGGASRVRVSTRVRACVMCVRDARVMRMRVYAQATLAPPPSR